MDMNKIGFFLYMEEQERNLQEQEDVNVETEDDLERVQVTTNQKDKSKNFFS